MLVLKDMHLLRSVLVVFPSLYKLQGALSPLEAAWTGCEESREGQHNEGARGNLIPTRPSELLLCAAGTLYAHIQET